jgi:spore maturation protein CgeB
MKAQSKIYGYYLVDDVLTDKLMEEINEVVYKKTMEFRAGMSGKEQKNLEQGGNKTDGKKDDTVLHISREALSYAMAAQITREDRLLALKLLSGHYDVKLYSREQNQLLDKVTYMGGVDYDTEMPMVFKSSDINLNMTLRCIKSGIPLRSLDIMGAGGFLISNYQPELAESFIDGEEMVMYESIEDMYAKVAYYLKNPGLRAEIAKRGHDKISEYYRYDDRINAMLELASV